MSTQRSFLSHPVDFLRHNEEVKKVWDAFNKRHPYRVPVYIGGSIRNLFGNPEINTTGYTFEEFFKNPQAQIECQLTYAKWRRFNLVCDQEMGLPKDGWGVGLDFQNSYGAALFGCPIMYFGNDVPATEPILSKNKHDLYQLAEPDPLHGGIAGRAMEFFEYMQEKCPKMEFEGLPVKPPQGLIEGAGGPFQLACEIRGNTEVCTDMYDDPKYFHDLMKFLTDNIIRTAKAVLEWRWNRFPDAPDKGVMKKKEWGFGDDAIAMISTRDYEEFVFPYHQRIVQEFSDGGHIGIHLCGDASHHFKFLRDHLNVYFLDTGFPIDFGKIRQTLGPEVQIQGGPTIMLLKDGSPEDIHREVKRICESGIMDGGRFILREGNNLAPCTPVENIEAMYAAGKQYGMY